MDRPTRVMAHWPLRLAATVKRVANGFRDNDASALELTMPRGFADELARVVTWERARGDNKHVALEMLFLETLPTLRAQQALDRREPIRSLFHTPVTWHAMPRLTTALQSIFAALASIGAKNALGFSSLDELAHAHPTLDSLCTATYYGRFLPLLYAYPPDLAYANTLLATTPIETIIDRHFTSPIVHELMHFGAERTPLPTYLDECVAGFLGVHFLPSMAFPAPGEHGGLYAAPSLSQVGQWLVRQHGFARVLLAQAGITSWREVLGDRHDALIAFAHHDYEARRPAHLLSDNFLPQRWLKVIAGIAPDAPWRALSPSLPTDADWEIVHDGLRAMCLWPAREHDTFRVHTRQSAPVTIDLDACEMTSSATFDGHSPRYLFPPSIAAALRSRDLRRITLPPLVPDALVDELARLRARLV